MLQAPMPLCAGNYLEKMYGIAVWERYTISYSSKNSLEGGENIFWAICWRILQRRMKIVTFFYWLHYYQEWKCYTKPPFCHVLCSLSKMNVFSIGLTKYPGLAKVVSSELTWRFDCVVSRHTQFAPVWSTQAATAAEKQWLSILHRQGKAMRILHPHPGCWSLLRPQAIALSLWLDKKARLGMVLRAAAITHGSGTVLSGEHIIRW